MKITPTWVGNFETRLNTLIDGSSERMARNLIWDRIMDVRDSATGRELYFWLIESAKLRREGQGGNKRFDDLVANSFEITNENVGDGLILTKNEIEDNMMAGENLRGMPALDYAGNWARQMGANAARWPQDVLFELLAAGETTRGYDGEYFFSGSHPINPFNSAAGTYANLFKTSGGTTGPGACPIDSTNASTLDTAAANFAKAVAYVQGLTGANGRPRNLVVKHALAGVGLRKRLFEILDTKFLSTSGIENVVSRYGIEPLIAAEIPATDLYYYLVCEIMPGEGGPLVFQKREDFALSSYSLLSLAELQRRKEFEWSYDGRNAGAYGHPYLIFKVKPT